MYWPDELLGDCCSCWSSSEETDSGGFYGWIVHFHTGAVDVNNLLSHRSVRCVC
ncbi:MAG: hypothetical protein FJ098_03580 [Deltaproteobacteria bacterium]|nr:hypothetical protein [Deltaproteobacteria bacterium]